MKDIDLNLKCWYKEGCNLARINCEKTCHRYLEMNFLINNCGMPNASRYIKPLKTPNMDKQTYIILNNLKNNIISFVEEGKNLYITSLHPNNGKTTWALKILYKYFDEIWCGNGFKLRGYFIHVPTMLENFNKSNFRETEEYNDIMYAFKRADLVVWDDITSLPSKNDGNFIYKFLGPRYIEGKSNIFTGNKIDKELQDTVGDSLFNKIWNLSKIVELKSKSYREN